MIQGNSLRFALDEIHKFTYSLSVIVCDPMLSRYKENNTLTVIVAFR